MLKTRADLTTKVTLREWYLMRHVMHAVDAVRFAGTSTGRICGKLARDNLAQANAISI